MPKFSAEKVHDPIKMILMGDSGNGKTGALASLALAGYKLRILDYDKGLEPMRAAILKAGKPEALANVEYVSLDDQYQIVGGKVIPKGVPTAFANGLKLMEKWGPMSVVGAEDLGNPATWGLDTILVLDSLSHFCNAAMRYTQALSGNSGKNPTQPEWGTAQQSIEAVLALLYSAQFHTNIIVTAHINYVQGKEMLDSEGNAAGMVRGLPNSLGVALPPKIPQYFNHMLIVEKRGAGAHARRFIQTVPTTTVSAKSPILTGIPAELPLETGLASYFDVALGKSKGVIVPPPVSATPTAGATAPVQQSK